MTEPHRIFKDLIDITTQNSIKKYIHLFLSKY